MKTFTIIAYVVLVMSGIFAFAVIQIDHQRTHTIENKYLNEMKLKIKNKTTLGELPAGSLFMSERTKTIGLKSEYRTEKGAIEAYIVGSGEFFWGGATTVEEQHNLIVYELQLKNKHGNN